MEHANETNCVHVNFILVGYIFRVKFTTFNLEDYNKNEKKIYPVHKRTDANFIFASFLMYYIKIFSFSIGLPKVQSWLNDGFLR